MCPHPPITPDEIIKDALASLGTGAAILHLQARDPKTGRPDQTPEAFARFLLRIKQQTGAVINIASGGSPHINFKPEVASLTGAVGTEDGAPDWEVTTGKNARATGEQ